MQNEPDVCTTTSNILLVISTRDLLTFKVDTRKRFFPLQTSRYLQMFSKHENIATKLIKASVFANFMIHGKLSYA